MPRRRGVHVADQQRDVTEDDGVEAGAHADDKAAVQTFNVIPGTNVVPDHHHIGVEVAEGVQH